jgi:lipoyl-dependent peroxiredoxin subunit C
MDFTFICPTEIAEFGKKAADFADRDAQVLGMSTDTHFVHLAWRRDHPDLRSLPFPHARRYQARALDRARHPSQE